MVLVGKGKPRPLLEGVYRKACDYCVRSKRGCNGGKPCEQCVRRDQPCSYSQRRKSGPRGPPVRPKSTAVTVAVCSRGTRTSARRAKARLDGSPEPSKLPLTSSPARTASVSSVSTSSVYSRSDDSSSDSEAETPVVRKQESGKKEEYGEERLEQKRQGAKRGKILGTGPGLRKEMKSTPLYASPAKPAVRHEGRSGAVSPLTVEAAVPPPSKDMQLKVMVPKVSPSCESAAQRVVWPLMRNASPNPVQRSASSTPFESKTSSQQLQKVQQQRLSTASMGALPTAVSPAPPSNGNERDVNMPVHEISMRPWEISLRPWEISHSIEAEIAGTTTFGILREAAKAENVSMETAPVAAPTVTQLPRSVPEAAPSFGGELELLNHEKQLCDELLNFTGELDCKHWEPPCLTRETSLARVVERLGGDGGGYEGSFVGVGAW